MKGKRCVFIFMLIGFSMSAQIKGIVKDSITGKPIAYANIWVENENIGATSEDDGTFSINTNEKTKKLIFLALGFEKKIIKASQANEVKLKPEATAIEEVVISRKRETKQIEIGKTKNTTYQAFDNGPRIDVKYFPYLAYYKKTKYIKQVSIFTDSHIENASFKIHFYNVDSNGFPGEEILNKDFIVSVKKGMKKTAFNISEFNLQLPKNGVFVGFEKLVIEKNKMETTITDYNTNTTRTKITYFPFVLYNYVEKEFLYTFSGGKWNRQTKETNSKPSDKMMINEPAINLILTN